MLRSKLIHVSKGSPRNPSQPLSKRLSFRMLFVSQRFVNADELFESTVAVESMCHCRR